jgi:hypothetical protein
MYTDTHVLTLRCDSEKCLRPRHIGSQVISAEFLDHALAIAVQDGWTLRGRYQHCFCPQCTEAKRMADGFMTVADRHPAIGDKLIFGARTYRVVEHLYECGLRIQCDEDESGCTFEVRGSQAQKLRYDPDLSASAPQLAPEPGQEGEGAI